MLRKRLVDDLPLRIDKTKLMNDFTKGLVKALKVAGEYIKNEMLLELAKSHGTGKPSWVAEVSAAIDYMIDDVALKSANQAVVKVGLVKDRNEVLMFKALLVNYGMGTEMDLAGSEYVLPREDTRVFTRPGEDVYDPDTGSSYPSTASPPPHEITGFHQPPVHYFENGLTLAMHDFERTIDEYIDGFDFSAYVSWKNK